MKSFRSLLVLVVLVLAAVRSVHADVTFSRATRLSSVLPRRLRTRAVGPSSASSTTTAGTVTATTMVDRVKSVIFGQTENTVAAGQHHHERRRFLQESMEEVIEDEYSNNPCEETDEFGDEMEAEDFDDEDCDELVEFVVDTEE